MCFSWKQCLTASERPVKSPGFHPHGKPHCVMAGRSPHIQNDFSAAKAEEYARAFNTTAQYLLLGASPTDAGIDKKLRALPPDISSALIERFNAMIEGVYIAGKIK
jgi:hypothetical protein